MSAFHPTQSSIDPPPLPDVAADAVVRSLGRHLIRRRPWGPVKALILGGISCGIWPAISWARHFHNFIVAEQWQLWHLAQWLHHRENDPELDLRPLVQEPGRRGILHQTLVLLLVIFGVCAALAIRRGATLRGIFRDAYGWQHHYHGVYFAWTSLLTVVYVLQAINVHRRYFNLHTFAQRFNMQMQHNNLPPVNVPDLTGRRIVLWLLAALVGLYYGAIWAIPAAVVGSLQAAYQLSVSRLTRGQMSARVHQLLAREHPDKQIPLPRFGRARCKNTACLAFIPAAASYCPRCGRRVVPPLDAKV